MRSWLLLWYFVKIDFGLQGARVSPRSRLVLAAAAFMTAAAAASAAAAHAAAPARHLQRLEADEFSCLRTRGGDSSSKQSQQQLLLQAVYKELRQLVLAVPRLLIQLPQREQHQQQQQQLQHLQHQQHQQQGLLLQQLQQRLGLNSWAAGDVQVLLQQKQRQQKQQH
ncbi:hypothetical protein Emag_007560 [Eimeria magna]